MGEKKMIEGRVVDFDPVRGTGTIEADSGELLPVHRSAIVDDQSATLFSGDLVAFSLGRNKFGKRAAQDVKRIGWEEEDDSDEPREWNF